MKEKRELYDQAMDLLEGCNTSLQGDPLLPTINILLTSVVKNLNEIRIETITGTSIDETNEGKKA